MPSKHSYTVVIERAERNVSAYVPVLPGCVATGATEDEVATNLREAIRMHIEGMIEDGEPVPAPSATSRRIDADVTAA